MVLDFHAHLDRDPITKEYDVTGLLQDMDCLLYTSPSPRDA